MYVYVYTRRNVGLAVPTAHPTPTNHPMHAQALENLIPKRQVIKVIVASPHLLTFNVEQNIAPKIDQLKELLPGRLVDVFLCQGILGVGRWAFRI